MSRWRASSIPTWATEPAGESDGAARTVGVHPAPEHLTTTFYQRLGVTPSASTAEIRVAYRALAGRLHPDRMIDASTGERALAERRMREVNEAWSALSDPARRRAYDDTLLGGSRRPSARPSASRPRSSVPAVADDDDDLVDVMGDMGPVQAGLFRHGPWMALVVIFVLIFVVSAYATSGGSGPDPAPSPRAAIGTCVDVKAGPTTTVVPCTGPHDLRIVERIPDGGDCPGGSEKRRLAVDGYLDCVQTR